MRTLALALALAASGCADSPALKGFDATAGRSIADEIDGARLMASVQKLSDAHLTDETRTFDCNSVPRDYEPDCHHTRLKARAVLQKELEEAGFTVRLQETAHPEFPTANLVAELPGTTKPKEIVLVGAHYDAFYGGADDNSTGVAAVLEIARVLKKRSFARTVRFVGFDLEEMGLTGSTRYVASLATDETMVGGIIFDSIGFFDPTEGAQTSITGLPAPSTGDFVAVFAGSRSTQLGVDVGAIAAQLSLVKTASVFAPDDAAFPMVGNLLRSDHAPFWMAGLPAVFLTDTANFRNPHYHTPTDTPDKVNAEFLTGVTRLSAVSLAHWAGGAP